MKKRMLFLLLGVSMIASSAMPAYAAPIVRTQPLLVQREKSTIDANMTGLMTQVNVTKQEVELTDSSIKFTSLDIFDLGNTTEENGTQYDLVETIMNEEVSDVVDTKIVEAQTLAINISNIITQQQEEVQRLIEEERKAEEERKRKEEEERKRKEEEERKRKEEEERKRKEEEERKRREEEARKQQSSKNSATGTKIVSYAKKFIGNPYVYGGNSLTNGIDCSHFVYQVLKNCGAYNGGYVTSAGWRTKGQRVASLSQAQAGDIICYDGHVAIYDGNGMLVEALGKKHGICHKRKATSDKILAIRRFV